MGQAAKHFKLLACRSKGRASKAARRRQSYCGVIETGPHDWRESPGKVSSFRCRGSWAYRHGQSPTKTVRNTAPRWLFRDRDAIYGEAFRQRVAGMGIGEVLSAPSSPWQNPYAERLIGSIRRDCLNHVVVLGEQHLRRVLAGYLAYYHGSRTHLSLAKDAPTPRRVQGVTEGDVIAFREVG